MFLPGSCHLNVSSTSQLVKLGFEPSTNPGLLPMCIHADGAEFYTNNEFMVWSLQCIFASGNHVWDSKFPLCVIPVDSLRDADIQTKTQQVIAELVAWSLDQSTKGIWPSEGPHGQKLVGAYRTNQIGQQLAGGYRGCYFGFRCDGKARKECNMFQRSYMHSLICEACLAQRHHKDWQPLLNYKNFYPSAAHRLTTISPAPSCSTNIGQMTTSFEPRNSTS